MSDGRFIYLFTFIYLTDSVTIATSEVQSNLGVKMEIF